MKEVNSEIILNNVLHTDHMPKQGQSHLVIFLMKKHKNCVFLAVVQRKEFDPLF